MRCNDSVDRISQLPDDHIIKILSFLSLEEAAATSVLSSRWIHLWKHTPNLIFVTRSYLDDFAHIERHVPKYINWVNSVIESHKALSLKQFTISFVVYKSNQQAVSKWLQFALSRRVEWLDLDFQMLDLNHSQGLVLEEILRESNIPSCDFKFLKELSLNKLKVSGEAIKLILRNCPLLEGLNIVWSILTSDLEIIGGMLKHLDIRTRYSLNFTKVCAPNLTWLGASYISNRLLLENVPKLVQAEFTFAGPDTMHHFANAAAKLEILTITLYAPMAFSVPEMPKLNKLIVNYCEVYQNNLFPVTCLLRASPCLEQFKIEISDLFPTRYGVFEVPNNVEKSPHQHLIAFQFSGFCVDADDHIELLRYIVDNCVVLERILIRPPFPKFSHDDSDDVVKDAWKTTKECTRQQLAGKFKVPHHIKLFVI